MQAYRVYKPRKTNDGNAVQFQHKEDKKDKFSKHMVMMQMVPQDGTDANDNATFTWTTGEKYRGITAKLGLPDIGEFLCVLNGIKQSAGSDKGLYHQNNTGSLGIKMELNDKGYYAISLSKKDGDKLTRLSITLTLGEAEILRSWLNQFLIMNFT